MHFQLFMSQKGFQLQVCMWFRTCFGDINNRKFLWYTTTLVEPKQLCNIFHFCEFFIKWFVNYFSFGTQTFLFRCLNKMADIHWIKSHWCLCEVQGWGQFRFFNSIPIPIPLFSIPIPIPIPLLTISFNSNSNSNSRHFNSNSNSNSGELKSNLNSWNDLLMSSSKFIMIIITRYMYTKLLLLIPSVSYPLLNGYNYMALVDPISIA